MPNRLTRRQFLQAGALGTAAVVVSGCTVNLQRTEHLESYVHPPEEGLPGENLWFASTCRQCPAGCGIVVRTSEGRARKVEGNPAHPLNRGKLCARGQAALQELYDPDRLRNAVRQVERGTQRFEPLYWEDALAALSQRLAGADPGAVAFLGGNLSTHLWAITRRFVEARDGRPPVVYSLGDSLSGQQALVQTSGQLFGTEALPYFDVGGAEVVFSFGANFLETWLSPVHYSRAYGQMRRGALGQRGYLVQFEPRLSSTGAAADEWIAVQPGTEALVALGLARIVAEERGQAASAMYQPVDLAAVAAASGVAAEELERLGRIFAGVSRPLAIPGGTLSAHGGGLDPLAAVQGLNLLAGGLGQPGSVSLVAGTAPEAFRPAPLSTYADVQGLIEDMAAGRVQVLMVHGLDPVFELPADSGFRQALANVPFVVSFSPAVDDTAALADLILPDHTNLEGWGYHVPALAGGGECLVVGSQQPAMRPLYDTRATADVLLALARELGGPVAQALPWDNEVDFLRETVDGLRVDGLRGGAGSAEAFWAEWRRQGGRWPQEQELRDCHLASAGAGVGQAAQVPSLSETAWAGLLAGQMADKGDYPYDLYLYPSVTLFDGRGGNKSWLQEAPDPMTTVAWQTWIEVAPHTAEVLGVDDNDVVRVISPAGEVEAIVYVYPGLAEEVVAMPLGRGHEHYGRFAKGQGSNPMRLVASAADVETGALAWGATRVRIEPADRKQVLARLESDAGVEYVQEGH